MRFKISATVTDHDISHQLVGQADYSTANLALADALRMCNESGYEILRFQLTAVQPEPSGFHFRTPHRKFRQMEQEPIEAPMDESAWKGNRVYRSDTVRDKRK